MSDASGGSPVRPGVTLTRAQIVAYAAQFDPQPQHLDEAAAAATGFGELVASGWQTASVSMRLAEAACPALAEGLYRVDSLTWQRPVRPGDTLFVAVIALEPAEGCARFQIETVDGEGQAVLLMLATMLGSDAGT